MAEPRRWGCSKCLAAIPDEGEGRFGVLERWDEDGWFSTEAYCADCLEKISPWPPEYHEGVEEEERLCGSVVGIEK